MKLLFKQRFFSWFDSYDIYNEAGDTVFCVKGQLSWGHCLKIYDAKDKELGTVKERVFSWRPKFEIYIGDNYVGEISKRFSLFSEEFDIDFNGWSVEGDCFGWDYTVYDAYGRSVASVSKALWNFTDTYEIDVDDPANALMVLMLVLAIDAEKCSNS